MFVYFELEKGGGRAQVEMDWNFGSAPVSYLTLFESNFPPFGYWPAADGWTQPEMESSMRQEIVMRRSFSPADPCLANPKNKTADPLHRTSVTIWPMKWAPILHTSAHT